MAQAFREKTEATFQGIVAQSCSPQTLQHSSMGDQRLACCEDKRRLTEIVGKEALTLNFGVTGNQCRYN